MALCEIDFEIQYSRPHALDWKMVCRIFGLITIHTSFWLVFCTNNEILGRNWWITLIFAPPVPFILLFFIFAPLFLYFLSHRSSFLCFIGVALFYLSWSICFISFYFFFFLFYSLTLPSHLLSFSLNVFPCVFLSISLKFSLYLSVSVFWTQIATVRQSTWSV